MKQVYNERAWISHVSCPSSGIELNTHICPTHLYRIQPNIYPSGDIEVTHRVGQEGATTAWYLLFISAAIQTSPPPLALLNTWSPLVKYNRHATKHAH